jgi:polysaccharide export outer membrane protein
MKNIKVITILAIVLIGIAGCGDKFWDPKQVGRFRPVPASNLILDSLGVAEENPSTWEGAEDPKPADIIAYQNDYTFASGDVVRILIHELQQESQPFSNDYVVTETGNISIPEVGIVEAGGLTESQLEDKIKEILTPNILKNPIVTVTLIQSQQDAFSIWGNAVPRPGRYNIPRYDFRLTDALAIAQVNTQYNVSYIYVSRNITGKEDISNLGTEQIDNGKKEEEKLEVPKEDMLEVIAPHAQRMHKNNVVACADFVSEKDLTEAAIPEGFEPVVQDVNSTSVTEANESAEGEWVFKDGKWVQVEQQQAQQPAAPAEKPEEAVVQSEREVIEEPINENEQGQIEWVFKDGKWVPELKGKPELPPQAQETAKKEQKRVKTPDKEAIANLSWDSVGSGGTQSRVIKIPTDRLAAGDPKYNIIVKPGDSVHIPVDVIGEFCIMGNVNNQGFIPLTGRPMTLRMAVASAGGLGELAWPKKCEITRRIAKNREVTVLVDLEKITSGEQPDFFIKPLDTINVGTHPTSYFRYVLRNAFTASYGVGASYSRNFADRDAYTRKPFPDWSW